jgi:hypothetical protein
LEKIEKLEGISKDIMHVEWLKWAFQFSKCHTYKGGKISLGNMPSNYTKKIGVGLS